MTKQELILDFIQNHRETSSYINDLVEEEFMYRYHNKWSAGQHLKHILLTIMPFSKVLASKEFILTKFGTLNRPTWSNEMVLANYFRTSLKAPEQFLPEDEVTLHQRSKIIADIQEELENIEKLWTHYSEGELDTLTIPHPLLGQLSIREMFYLMTYHPLHHKKQIETAIEGHYQQGNT